MFEMSTIVTQHLWLGLSLFMILIIVLNRTNFFQKIILGETTSLTRKIMLIVLFSAIGILGTYWSIQLENGMGMINTRAVGVIVSGLIGGVEVGTITGFFVGLHRYYFIDTFTSFESGITTLIQGYLAGRCYWSMRKEEKMWPYALYIGFVLEAVHMLILIIFARPLDQAIELVSAIAPAMLVTNPIGIAAFIGIMEDTYKRNERIKAATTKTALYIANLTTVIFRSGFNTESARETIKSIIKAVDNFDCVAILTQRNVLAFACKNEWDEKKTCSFLHDFIQRGFPPDLKDSDFIKVNMLVPIYNGDIQVASLFLGKQEKNPNTDFEKELATGLGNLLSAQIEIGRVKEQAKLFANAELKALQSQINPHFLFNALNTISYHCRQKPETAKKLITYLADYYRHNLSDSSTLIPLSKELQHINAYVNIETARFGDRLNVSYMLEGDYSEIKLPALIIQPLVENAIKHGIQPKVEGGNIVIELKKYDDYFEFIVSDDGVGVSEEKLKTILDPDTTRKSIGLSNVHKRLITIYGPDNGLNIISKENKGTTVSFKIPV